MFCESRLKECISLVMNNNNIELKSKISKTSKVTAIESLNKEKTYEIELLKDELNANKCKIKELNLMMAEKDEEIDKLKKDKKDLEFKLKESSTNSKCVFK